LKKSSLTTPLNTFIFLCPYKSTAIIDRKEKKIRGSISLILLSPNLAFFFACLFQVVREEQTCRQKKGGPHRLRLSAIVSGASLHRLWSQSRTFIGFSPCRLPSASGPVASSTRCAVGGLLVQRHCATPPRLPPQCRRPF
jgi:hypothetical protein